MMSKRSVPKPAPGDLQIILALVSTVGPGPDVLESTRGLGIWLAKWGLLPSGTELTESDVRRAREVRDGLRRLMWGHSGGKVDPRSIEALDQALAGAGPRLHVDRDGSTRMQLLARTFEEALGSLIGLVHIAQLAGTWPRFKICLDQQCGNAYYDYATNRVSKWCSRRCGNRIRARVFRNSDAYRRR